MNYLEVKYEKQDSKENSFDNFVSNVIKAQNSLGSNTTYNAFDEKKLLSLGFIKNSSTKGFGIKKEFTFEEIKKLAFEIDKLENHILTHGFIEIKIYKEEVYFWDKALIYESLDDFEYCLRHHNKFQLGDINIVSISDSVNEELLNLANFTKRYCEPSLEFITQGCVWDKKQGLKVSKTLVKDIIEYMPKDEVLNYQ